MHSGIRGFVLCATMPLRFVAARLPVPPGVGPATHRTPGRNAEAFRYKMRGGDAGAARARRASFAFHFSVCLSHPPRNAEAFRYKMQHALC